MRLQDVDENDSTAADMEQEDPEFESELERFRQRLERSHFSNVKYVRVTKKLKPNIPEDWIVQLRLQLKYQCDFASPKQGGASSLRNDLRDLPDGLRMKTHQHSA